ncbi:MAG: GTP cyclohydrolase I FolE [Thermoanaerobaculia bacterium]
MDQARIAAAVREILLAIGEDPEREGLLETPARVARAYGELFGGLAEDPSTPLERTFTHEASDLVVIRDIPFHSMCEHHLLPFFGTAAIAYIPAGRVAGLSKLPRAVEILARRPQLQERLTAQVADAVLATLGARGVSVATHAEHLCMRMRGAKAGNSFTTSIAHRGAHDTDRDLRQEVLAALELGSRTTR